MAVSMPKVSALEGDPRNASSMPDISRIETETVWPTAKLIFNPGSGEIKATCAGKTTASLTGVKAEQFRSALGEKAAKLKKDKELKNVAVRVIQTGNLIILLGLAS
ncbi:hypothetical protein CCP4SC76_860002 [Gammaproteobacteria bacterium]